MSSLSPHVDPETLAAFAEGRLDAAKRDAVVAHIDHCRGCMDDVALVMSTATAESERRRFGRPSWLLALAAALVLAVALPFAWHVMRHGSATDALVSLSPRSARIVEPRLTGGFPWAAYHGPMRAAGGSVADAERLKLGGAAGELMQRAEHDPSAEAQHAAGVALVLVDRPDDAIGKLESAASVSHDAKSWSDLAAARYAAAVQFRRPSLYPEALAASDDALRADPRLPEALFNRALILENMGLISEARKAWQRYLEVDPGSQWANEARDHLARLPATTGASRWERDQPLLEAAAASGDARKTLSLVDQYRERARRFAEAEYLGRWAESEQQKNETDATKWLTISRSIGNALVQLSGESLLRDAVHAIDNADESTRAKIAEAHVAYRRGRIAFSRDQAESAERDLRAAAALFESANDPMSLMARHYAAAARLARNDVAVARGELERLRENADAHPGYLGLRATVRWELVRAVITNGDRSSQIQTLTEASELFHRAGERVGETDAQTALAISHDYFGHPDEAWTARIQSFHALSGMAESAALERTVEEAVHTELKAGRMEAALALSNVTEALQGPATAPLVAVESLLQKMMIEAATGQLADGMATALRIEQRLTQLPDANMRAFQHAGLDMARGALLANSDPVKARSLLTSAIDFYRTSGRSANLPEPLLLRARAEEHAGDTAAAARDLEEGVEEIEHHPVRVEGVGLGTYVLNAGDALFTDAVRFHLDHHSNADAFRYADRSLGGDGVTVGVLQQRLKGSGSVIIETLALPGEVVTFAVSRNDFQVARTRALPSAIADLTERVLASDDRSWAAELYDVLLRPVAGVLSHATSVIVVADQKLSRIPFAALIDSATGRRLIELQPVVFAANASSLQSPSAHATRSITAMALPSGDESATLTEPEKELADVTAPYARATPIGPRNATWAALQAAATTADVVHIAGHTERQPGDGEEALLFAGSSGRSAQRVSWKTVLAAPLHARVIVLAACETLKPPRSATRGLSLASAFSAGGADVIGTLMPIPDRDSRTIFGAVHRQLAAGYSAADALRTAQIEALHGEESGDGTRAWRAVAVLTRRIPQ